MSFVPLVQAWEASREERTPMPARQRVASIEYATGRSQRPPTFLEWLLGRDDELDLEPGDDEREIGG